MWKGTSTVVSVFYNEEDMRGNAKRIITTADMDENVSTLVVEGYPGSEMITLESRRDYKGISPSKLDDLVTLLAKKHLMVSSTHEHAEEKSISVMMRKKGFHVQILGAVSPGWYKPAEDGCIYRVSSRNEPMPTTNDKPVYVSVSRQDSGHLSTLAPSLEDALAVLEDGRFPSTVGKREIRQYDFSEFSGHARIMGR